MKLFTRATTITLPLLAALTYASGCPSLLDDDDSSLDDDDSAGVDEELDCEDGVDNDADGVTDCDDPDCAMDEACSGPTYVWVAVRSRTATQADIDTNTPGPDIDAVELFDGVESHFIDVNELFNVQGAAGGGGNNNDNVLRVGGIPDSNIGGGDCDLSEEPNGTFWSMGGGDINLGDEGWLIAKFEGVAEIVTGDEITVYEVGAGGCDNVGTARDDEYEIYIGTTDATIDTVDELDGTEFMSLGTTGNGGDSHTVSVP